MKKLVLILIDLSMNVEEFFVCGVIYFNCCIV